MKTTLYRCGSLLLLGLLPFLTAAQISITAFPFTYNQQFNSFNGYSTGLPANWSFSGTASDRGQGTGSGNAGGIWAYGNAGEYSLGALASGTSPNINYTVTFRNNAALPITSLTIAYDFEQWRYGGGNTNGFTVTQTGIGASVSGLNTSSGVSSTGTPTVTPKTITLNGLSIAPNTNFTISWFIGDGSGNDNGVAIDNFVLTATSTAVPTPPVVTRDPVNDTACAGNAAAFSITASNATSYQWQEYTTAWSNLSNGGVYAGATTAALAISNAAGLNGRQYRCIAIGAASRDTSTAATLLLNPSPAITVQPVPAAVCPLTDTAFSVTATGANLTFQWQVDPGSGFVNLANNATYSGVATSKLHIAQPGNALNGYQYRCVVTGDCLPNAVSNAAMLTVYPLPVATTLPATAFNFCKGDSLLITANTGTGLTYQWLFNNTPLPAANAYNYKDTASGAYAVIVTDTNGCHNTSASVLTTSLLHSASITPLSSLSFCTGGEVKLVANGGTGFTYKWLRNNVLIAGASTDTLIATTSGSYQVIVSNSIGCTDTSVAVVVAATAGPVAVINPQGPTSFCAGDSVLLDAGFIAGLTYEWRLNGTAIPGATADQYRAKNPGSYTVKVASSATCFTYAASVTVTVHALPTAQFFNASSPVFCQGDSMILAANTGLGFTYQWMKNNTSITGGTDDTLIVYNAGNYSLNITDSNSCANTSNVLGVTVNPLPAAVITPSANAAICQGDSLSLAANSGALLTYQWYRNGSLITGAANDLYKAKATGSYTVLVTDSNGCAQSSPGVSVAVNPLPSVVTALSGAAAFCQGNAVGISVPQGAGLTYQWLRDGNAVNGAGATYMADSSGAYVVKVTNTATTCTNTSVPVMITVHPLPAAMLTAARPTVFCAGDSVVLSANTGTSLVYSWLLNGQTVSGITRAQYTAKTSGAYVVVVTDSNACVKASDTQHVTVNPMPNNHITYSSPLAFCQGGAVVLTASLDTGITYQWLKNGQPQGITTYSNIVDATGAYSVIQTNSFNCTNTSPAVSVTVWPLPAEPVITRNGLQLSTGIYTSYQWFRNNQLLMDETSQTLMADKNGGYSVEVVDRNGCHSKSAIVFVNNVGIGSTGAAASIRIYPNPVQDILTISAPFKVHALLLDMQGRVLQDQADAQSMKLGTLPPGIYLLQLRNTEGTLIRTEKVNKVN